MANENGRGRRKKRRESKRLNLAIFLICVFLVTLSIHAGVLTKQTVKLLSKTVLFPLLGNSIDNKQVELFMFKYISLSMVCRSIPSDSRRIESRCGKNYGTN